MLRTILILVACVGSLYSRTCIANDLGRNEQVKQLNDGLIAYTTGNFLAAYGLLRPLAEQDVALAQLFMGRMYAEGNGVPNNCDRSVGYLRRAAEAGNADAAFDLALYAQHGRCVPQNESQALAWYELAAKHGDTRAPNAIGIIYLGQGEIARDFKKAAFWFRRGVKVYDADAYYHLGQMYAAGQNIPKDPIEAYMWFDLSASLSVPDQLSEPTKAAIIRDRIREELMPGQVSEGEKRALKFLSELLSQSKYSGPIMTRKLLSLH
jgi:TPR repeat protein